MTEGERCPRCGKELVIHGTFQTRGRFGFRPEELRLFSLSLQFPEVSLTTLAGLPAACGLVWRLVRPFAAPIKSYTTWEMRKCGSGWVCSTNDGDA